MALIDLKRDPTPKDLRVFGLLLPLFVAVFGWTVGHRSDSSTAASTVWAAGAGLVLVYLALPPVRRAVFMGWSYATYPIAWILSHVILGAVFFGIVTPIGILVRRLRQDPLERHWDPAARSYWTPRDAERDVRRYFRQF
ncbi:MAG: hypothetical protein KY454_12625 [Actinobacteria bacterium]|nr:hypothetical protein [Actinomycetota bacterium]MBW3650192.1 hypothetical protein [Actinomycetota bacterium]